MITLVPLSRFRVQFEVASGRPYSRLEALALRAIADGATTIDALLQVFHIHPRLLVEAVVTLTQAGWVAFGGGRGFLLTAEGHAAVTADAAPRSLTVAPRKTFVLMERVTGALLAGDETRFVTRRDLDDVWDDCARMACDVPENQLDEGQVQHLLPRRSGEWLRWVGPIDMVSKGSHWLPVNVSLDSGEVSGLPDAWQSRLRPLVLERAREVSRRLSATANAQSYPVVARRRREVVSEDPSFPRLPAADWRTCITPEDLLFTWNDHQGFLERVLRGARSRILIASAFATTDRMQTLETEFLSALNRGVSIDVLWGYAATDGGAATPPVPWLRKLAYTAKSAGAKGVLRFNATASGSHAKLVLGDLASGYEACVGSFNWLSAAAPADLSAVREASVRLTDPSVFAAIARSAATLWSGAESEVLAATGDRWRRIASELDSAVVSLAQQASTEPNCTVRLLFDREHENLLRQLLHASSRRVLVASHRLGPIAENRLAAVGAARAGTFDCRVFVGATESEPSALERARHSIAAVGGHLERVGGLHAKVLVADASAVITSYNFLSADAFGTASRGREIGIAIEGEQPANALWSRLSGLPPG